MIKELSIVGFRGFGEEQTIPFALPDGNVEGSGLTIMTGANNAGKTTIIESIRAFNNGEPPTFSEGKRNAKADYRVKLCLTDEEDKEYTIETVSNGGSSTKRNNNKNHSFYIVQSRRAIDFEFNKHKTSRDNYISTSLGIQNQRTSTLSNFTYRIFQIEDKHEQFDPILRKILGKDFKWTIEQRDSGNYYIKYYNDGSSHSAEGLGDGIWSVFTICAALFDAPENSTVLIDEPELSVHPALQKRLMDLLIEQSKHIQIIISTHSPYFINWRAIGNGAGLLRVVKEQTDCKCYELKENSRSKIKGILSDLNNPHTLGIDANEIFFLEDRIILVEGQEDVVIYNKISRDIGKEINGTFFGWGVGGAPKMPVFLTMLNELGYKKVTAIFDGDKKSEAEEAKKMFPNYHIITIREDDIRDKKERCISAKSGLTDDKGRLKTENKEYAINLIEEINESLS